MKLMPVERSMLGGFALAMLMLLLLSGMARLSTGRHEEAARDVINAYKGLVAMGEIVSNMRRAEEAQRHYLVEGETAYLKMRDDAVMAAEAAAGRSEQFIAAPELRDSLPGIRNLIAMQVALFHDTRNIPAAMGLAEAGKQFSRNGMVMDKLANAVDAMMKSETRLLQSRTEDEEKQHKFENFIYAILNLLLFMFFSALFFHLRRGMLLRDKSETALVLSHERRDLAQDLHDDLAQILAVARIKLTRMLKDDKAAGDSPLMHEINDLVKRANQSVRLLLAQINRAASDSGGLVQMFSWLVQELRLTHDIDVQLRGDISSMPADQQVDIVILRTVRDLLLQAASGGSKIDLVMEHIGKELVVTLSDGAGRAGFSSLAQHRQDGDISLDIIDERLHMVGGEMDIVSCADAETVVTLRVPARSLKQHALA